MKGIPVLVLNEKERMKDKRVFGEQYSVRFWITENGITSQKEEIYFVINSRKAHKQVEAKWRKEYPEGNLISVKYC